MRRRRQPRSGGQVSLSQIIEAGLVAAPQRLFRRYKGKDLEATLLPSGEVGFQGASYVTCSAAAEAARATVTGRRMNTNGWTFWQHEDAVGDVHQLDALRQQLASREPARVPEQPPLKLTGRPPEGRTA